MKIGIVSDIHGDVASLHKALKLLEYLEVDKIVCAGDLVDGAPEDDALVTLLQSMNIPCVQGNHDRDAFADQALLRRKLRQSGETQHDHLLKSETVAYLTVLPMTYEFDVDCINVCVAHGTPHSNTHYLFPESPLEKFQSTVNQTDADMLILGHTHVPMFVECAGKYIVNVGSVYRNRFEGSQTCGVLDTDAVTVALINIQTSKISKLPLTMI